MIDVIEKGKSSEQNAAVNDTEYTFRYIKDGKSPRTGHNIRDSLCGDIKPEVAKSGMTGAARPGRMIKLYRPIIFSVAIVMIATLLYRRAIKLDTSAHTDSVIVSVEQVGGVENKTASNVADVTLKELGYYIYKAETEGNITALNYDADDPKAYWNLYMNQDGSNSGYVSDLARDAALDYCIRDTLYEMEAKKAGFSLGTDELADADYDAEKMYSELSDKARKNTGLDEDLMKEMVEREYIAHAYMRSLAESDVENGDASSVLEAVTKYYDIGGSYYTDLLGAYSITVNDELWNNVRVGFVTINND